MVSKMLISCAMLLAVCASAVSAAEMFQYSATKV